MRRIGCLLLMTAVVAFAGSGCDVKKDSAKSKIDGIEYMDVNELKEKVLSKNWDALDIIDTAAQPQQALEQLGELAKNDDADVRELALNGVAMIKAPEVPAILAGALSDEDGDIRLFALQALQIAYDESIVAELAGNLSNEDTEIRSGAALLLGNIGQESGVNPIEKQLKAEQNELAKRDLKLALAKLGNEQLKDEFASQMDVPDSDTRLRGLADLKYIGDKGLAGRLLPALDDSGQAHLITDKNQPVPEYARVCDATINLVVLLYEHNPFQFEVDEFKKYSDDEIEQARAFLEGLKAE